MRSKATAESTLASAERDGIDLSLLRERLRWTPTERIMRHQAALALAQVLSHARRRAGRSSARDGIRSDGKS